jgi:hypothetical protein
MTDRYDLEQAIMIAWQTSDDIDLLFKHHGDAPRPMTEDEVGNALLGIKVLHDMRMEKLMDTYSRKFELDQYCTDPQKLAARNAMFGDVHEFLNPVESKGNAFTKKFKKGKKK